MKFNLSLKPKALLDQFLDYKKFKGCSKYKDNKASILIALTPPKFTKTRCASVIQKVTSYTSPDGYTRNYTHNERQSCPYQKSTGSWSNICSLFGVHIGGYRTQRPDICCYVFGKCASRKMIKNWRPLKQLPTFIRGLYIRYLDRMLYKSFITQDIYDARLNQIKTLPLKQIRNLIDS